MRFCRRFLRPCSRRATSSSKRRREQVFIGIRKHRTEGLLGFCAVPLVAISLCQRELHKFLHVRMTFVLLGFNISLATISTILSLLVTTVMLLRRFLQTQRKREQWKTEIEQAQQVQHVLIPDELPSIAGFAIESEYRPAREVVGGSSPSLPTISSIIWGIYVQYPLGYCLLPRRMNTAGMMQRLFHLFSENEVERTACA